MGQYRRLILSGAAVALGSLVLKSFGQPAVPPGQVQNNPAGQTYNAETAPPAETQAPQANAAPATGAPIDAQGDGDWPRVYVVGTTTNTVYQPQIESWDGYTLTARNAVAIQTPDQPEPVYGVMKVQAHTMVNKTERTVDVQNVQVLSSDFPTAPDRQQEYLSDLQASFPHQFNHVSLDRLEASLSATQQQEKAATQPLNNTPPQIIFANRPSVLVYIDGAAKYREVPGTDLSRVINTRVLLLKDNKTGMHYLHVLNGYLSAPHLNGPWAVSAPPPGASVAEDEARKSEAVDLLEGQPDPTTHVVPQLTADTAPSVYVSTKPAELVTFEGQPDFIPIPGTQLLYVSNTTGNVFKSLTDGHDYVLISGRWYTAPSLNGPWQYLPANQLPAEFSQIPDASPKENVKASVAGTPQAQEAVIENSIPQSAQVSRDTAIQPPQFDGAPQMAPISGTPLSYVVNSDTPVIEVGPRTWYACQNGVWYFSQTVNGPWAVADLVPPVIYTIPPSSPLYYVTFVRLYNATPEYVDEGYTPGYMGAEVSPDNTVVYGTGYDYQPWIGTVWYGCPVTWGLGCGLAWTPWYGWNFGFGFGWGWGSIGFGGWCHPPGPWWGPFRNWSRFSWGRMAAWGPGGWAHTGLNVYDRRFGTFGYNTFGANRWHSVYGRSYNSRTGALSAGHRAQFGNVFNTPSRFSRQTVGRTGQFGGTQRNNLTVRNNQAFATPDGNVFLRDNNANRGWRTITPSRSYPESTYSTLGRENNAREMGNQRFDTFRNTYPSGGFHGGGEERGFGGARSPGGVGGGHGAGGGGGGHGRR